MVEKGQPIPNTDRNKLTRFLLDLEAKGGPLLSLNLAHLELILHMRICCSSWSTGRGLLPVPGERMAEGPEDEEERENKMEVQVEDVRNGQHCPPELEDRCLV